MSTVISVENISKFYKLGSIGGATLREDLHRWWAKMRGKPDPWLKIGQESHGNQDGEYIWALKDVSFEVKEGDILGIIGRNGAGKSTLLKIISRITAPTSGQIKIKGRVGSLLEVGTGFHQELTGRENIYLNGAILGMTRKEVDKKLDEIIDFAEIEQFVDTPVKRYSSGMFVRLAFAVAAHLDPEILVVDEVLAVGDVKFQEKCIGKMKNVSQLGRTVLFVSHNMGVIADLCPHCIALRRGMVHKIGPSKSIIKEYLGEDTVEAGSIALKLFKRNRQYFGAVKIEKISTLDQNNQVKNNFEYGDEIKFKINLKSEKMTKCIMSFSVYNDQGLRVYHIHSRDSKKEIEVDGVAEVTILVKNNYLNCGDYYISVLVTDVFNQDSDYVVNCLKFSVNEFLDGKNWCKSSFRVHADWDIVSLS